jgi:hypothetical protein
MADLFKMSPNYTLPLRKGKDLKLDVKRKVDGTYAAWPEGAVVQLVIEADPPVTAVAAINDYHAVVRVESEVCDVLAAGLSYRVEVELPDGESEWDDVPIQGRTVRRDA